MNILDVNGQDLVNGEVSWLDSDASRQGQKHWGLTRGAPQASVERKTNTSHDAICRICSLEVSYSTRKSSFYCLLHTEML